MDLRHRVAIVTAGDANFRRFIELTINAATTFDYSCIVYDLKDLGLGKRFYIDDPQFLESGYYKQVAGTAKRTRALHKPNMILDSGMVGNRFVAYLDGDSVLRKPLDHLLNYPFDIGVTVRKRWELRYFAKIKDNFKRRALGYLNAGTIFFQPTHSAKLFLHRWQALTALSGNDQFALNSLAAPALGSAIPRPYSVRLVDGIRIQYFPSRIYNNYYISGNLLCLKFRDKFTRIYHFRNGRARDRFELVRHACFSDRNRRTSTLDQD